MGAGVQMGYQHWPYGITGPGAGSDGGIGLAHPRACFHGSNLAFNYNQESTVSCDAHSGARSCICKILPMTTTATTTTTTTTTTTMTATTTMTTPMMTTMMTTTTMTTTTSWCKNWCVGAEIMLCCDGLPTTTTLETTKFLAPTTTATSTTTTTIRETTTSLVPRTTSTSTSSVPSS